MQFPVSLNCVYPLLKNAQNLQIGMLNLIDICFHILLRPYKYVNKDCVVFPPKRSCTTKIKSNGKDKMIKHQQNLRSGKTHGQILTELMGHRRWTPKTVM